MQLKLLLRCFNKKNKLNPVVGFWRHASSAWLIGTDHKAIVSQGCQSLLGNLVVLDQKHCSHVMRRPELIQTHHATSSLYKKWECILCPRGFDIGSGIISPSYFLLLAESSIFCPPIDSMKNDSHHKRGINTVSNALVVWWKCSAVSMLVLD